MKTSAPPPAPDPVATAKAQTDTNIKTATNQQQLNMVDQTNPYGKETYRQIGTWDNGTPKFQKDVIFSPQEMEKQNQQWEFDKLVNDLGIGQTKRLQGHLDKPIDLSNEAVESRLMELGRSRLDPLMASRRASLTTRLYNQGAMPGTPAWEQAMKQFDQQENDAYNQLLLSGRGQSVQEILTGRNQPINEITALMSGGQVTQPNFTANPQTSVAPTDLLGATYKSYELGPLAQWQAKQAQQNALMSGAFQLGGLALGGWGQGGFKKPGFLS